MRTIHNITTNRKTTICSDEFIQEDRNEIICEKGHEFCLSHFDNFLERSNLDLNADDPCQLQDWMEWLPTKDCPICQMEYITKEMVHDYLYRDNKTALDEVKQEIQQKFKTYVEYKEWLNDNK